MKRFMFLCLSGMVLVGAVYAAGLMTIVRPNSTATPDYYTYNLVCDSTDTLQIDTFYSDTVDLSERKYLAYNIAMTGYSLADSANDSVVVVIKGYGMYDGKFKTVLIQDTIPTTLGTLDSTAIISGTVKYDSLGFNEFYFETVVKDSFVSDAGVDTSVFRFDYRILETEVVDK